MSYVPTKSITPEAAKAAVVKAWETRPLDPNGKDITYDAKPFFPRR